MLLLFLLGMRNRSNSLTGTDGQPRGSVVAWPDKRQRFVLFLKHFDSGSVLIKLTDRVG